MEELLKLVGGGGGGAGLGAQAASGVMGLAFGQAQQLDASRYAIANDTKEDNKTLLISLSFIGGILLVIILAVVFAMR